ncbi:MAG TPA: nucleoside-diphosphate kinase [Candidatus Paceibacterota bacterium]
MTEHPRKERTLVVIKPDGVQRNLIGEIIMRHERIGLKLVAMKMLLATPEHIEKHYTLEPGGLLKTAENTIKGYKEKGLTPPSEDKELIAKNILSGLKKFMTSGPVIAMIWEGAHAIKLVRKMVGIAEPLSSDVGTIRGDFVLDSYAMADGDGRAIRNLMHASGNSTEAENEIKHWFTPEEVINYRLVQEEILYDVNLDGILE